MTVHESLSAQVTSKDGYLNLIDGKHVPPTTGEWIDNFDHSTGRPWAKVPASGVADVNAAVEAARRPKLGQSVAYLLDVGALAAATALAGSRLPVVGGLQPWQIVLILAGAPGLVMALLPFTFREPARRHIGNRKSEEPTSGGFAFLWANRRVFFPFLLAFCLVTLAAGAITTWTPSHMARAFGWTPTQFGSALGVVNIIGALSLVPTGMLLDHLYARGMRDVAVRFYTWILTLAAPGAAALYLLKDPIPFLIGFGLLAVIVLPYMIYATSTLSVLVPSELRGRITGLLIIGRITGLLIMMFSLFGTTLAPTVVASLTDFVFRDPAKLSYSMAVVVGGSLTGALVLLRYVLKALAPMLADPSGVRGDTRRELAPLAKASPRAQAGDL